MFCRPANVCLATLQDLLHANADPNIADNVGRTALSWAVTNKMGMALFAACHTIGHFRQRRSNFQLKLSTKSETGLHFSCQTYPPQFSIVVIGSNFGSLDSLQIFKRPKN